MPFIDGREVGEEEYQATLKNAAKPPEDDRIMYVAVKWRGEEGAMVEGGFNLDYDWMDKDKKRAVLQMAMEALIANSVAMFPDDQEMIEFLDKQTHLGEGGGLRWSDQPPTPPDASTFEGGTHGDHD